MRLFSIAFLLAASAAAEDSATEWGRVRAYFSAGMVLSRDDAAYSKQAPFIAFNLDKNWYTREMFLVNTFFETRLTSIPVSAGTDRIVSSQKAASLGAGIYLPVLTTKWTFGERKQALFLAPLFKASFDTPTEAQVDHFYTASGTGARLGHFLIPEAEGAAPELISWVDIAYGRFTSIDDNRRRLSLEGALKAPGTPLLIGFSANIGRSGSARDDLRFFIGTRFDIGNLVAKLKKLP